MAREKQSMMRNIFLEDDKKIDNEERIKREKGEEWRLVEMWSEGKNQKMRRRSIKEDNTWDLQSLGWFRWFPSTSNNSTSFELRNFCAPACRSGEQNTYTLPNSHLGVNSAFSSSSVFLSRNMAERPTTLIFSVKARTLSAFRKIDMMVDRDSSFLVGTRRTVAGWSIRGLAWWGPYPWVGSPCVHERRQITCDLSISKGEICLLCQSWRVCWKRSSFLVFSTPPGG